MPIGYAIYTLLATVRIDNLKLNIMWNKNERIPSFGYVLYGRPCYRATTVALMKREKIETVTHKNGKEYTLEELEEAMLT